MFHSDVGNQKCEVEDPKEPMDDTCMQERQLEPPELRHGAVKPRVFVEEPPIAPAFDSAGIWGLQRGAEKAGGGK